MKRIEQKLRRSIGLDAGSIGSSLIERAVRLRMKEQALDAVEDYERLIETQSDEWNKLVESVVVTETWFFRDRVPFAALVRLVREQWLPNHPTAPLRVLSVPCSSGEEPYSVVMALVDAGVPSNRFQVDAADISTHALARAKAAVYGKNSFRGKELAFRERCFQKTKEGFLLDTNVRRKVHFHEANLFSEDFLKGNAGYDFIFCRNLLIYFDRPTQQIALQKIERLLAPSGVLFVGSAELPLALENGFCSVNLPMAFACTRVGDGTKNGDLRQVQNKTKSETLFNLETAKDLFSPQLAVVGDAKGQPSNNGRPSRPPADTEAAAKERELHRARRLADAGQLAEAVAICETHIRSEGPSAQAYYLLGLLRDASGDSSAIEWYRKALYLQPDHYETLLQMALLSEKDGDNSRARVFRDRARRAKRNEAKLPKPATAS
jgi:chemotaxis protein methyltransferase WspC